MNCAGEQNWNEALMVYCPYLRDRLRKTMANVTQNRRRATCYWNIAIATSMATHTHAPTDNPEGPISKPYRLPPIPSSLFLGFLLQNVGKSSTRRLRIQVRWKQ